MEIHCGYLWIYRHYIAIIYHYITIIQPLYSHYIAINTVQPFLFPSRWCESRPAWWHRPVDLREGDTHWVIEYCSGKSSRHLKWSFFQRRTRNGQFSMGILNYERVEMQFETRLIGFDFLSFWKFLTPTKFRIGATQNPGEHRNQQLMHHKSEG